MSECKKEPVAVKISDITRSFQNSVCVTTNRCLEHGHIPCANLQWLLVHEPFHTFRARKRGEGTSVVEEGRVAWQEVAVRIELESRVLILEIFDFIFIGPF